MNYILVLLHSSLCISPRLCGKYVVEEEGPKVLVILRRLLTWKYIWFGADSSNVKRDFTQLKQQDPAAVAYRHLSWRNARRRQHEH